jgi:hypothetical protein
MARMLRWLFIVSATTTVALTGCKKQAAPATNAAQLLEQSFQAEGTEVKQSIAAVSAGLKAGNYAEVTRNLEPIVTQRQLTEPQKQAVSTALVQMNQAIAANPSLDTKEMYETRAKMFEALRRGPRF